MKITTKGLPFFLAKKGVTSGGSRQFYFFKNKLPLKLSSKKLLSKLTSTAGRNNTGKIVMNSKKSLPKNFKKPSINHNFRSLNILFVANVILIPKVNKLISMIILSSGAITYVPTASNHELFHLSQFQSLLIKKSKFSSVLKFNFPYLSYRNLFFLILKLPKNKPISLIESLPKAGINFTRSPGSSALILKRSSLTGTALIKLSSGVKKIFSVYSLGSQGAVGLTTKKNCKVNKAGFYKNLGKKSIVRGVAKNPIDHPHGGRTKAIKYQRTPWGKTTKFK